MWWKALWSGMLLALAALPLSGQSPCSDTFAVAPGKPTGFMGGTPGGATVGGGFIPLFGWALDDDGILRVEILVDGRLIGAAQYGHWRPDIAALFPGFPDSAAAGWSYQLDSTQFPNGDHIVAALATSQAGELRFLNAILFHFNNTAALNRPFGEIGFPQAGANLFGVCDLANPARRFSVVDGWALDLGVEETDRGIGWVELMIDGSLIANTKTDCQHLPLTQGAFTNCYGLQRLDVEQLFPTAKDTPNAGFRFVLDVGELLNSGYVPGQHTLAIRAGDIGDQFAQIAIIPVVFICQDLFGNQGSFGRIDEPTGGVHGGLLAVTGWALDFEGVDKVLIYVDGILVGEATFGFPRDDVALRYPGFPDSAAAGWGFPLNTLLLPDGLRHVQVIVRDLAGKEILIGEVSFTVFNP